VFDAAWVLLAAVVEIGTAGVIGTLVFSAGEGLSCCFCVSDEAEAGVSDRVKRWVKLDG
jgi:hypothetical protein